MSNRNDGNGWKFDNPTDDDVIDALSRVLGVYMDAHPEVHRIKVRCYGEEDSLLHDFRFSRKQCAEAQARHQAEQDAEARARIERLNAEAEASWSEPLPWE